MRSRKRGAWSPWRPRVLALAPAVGPSEEHCGSRPTRSSSRRVSCRSWPSRATTSPRRRTAAPSRSSRRRRRRPSAGKGMDVTLKRNKRGGPPCSSTRASSARRQLRQLPALWDDTYVGQRRQRQAAPDALPGAAGAGRAAPEHRQGRGQIGRTINDVPILALKVTRNARTVRRRQRAGGPLLLHAARARVDHARDEPPAGPLFIDNYGKSTEPATHHASSSTPTSCGSSSSPTPTATTSPSRPATGCGARTCATTTATARSRNGDGVDPNRNFAHEVELRRRGLLARSRLARPTAAPARRPSPRRRPWTGSRSVQLQVPGQLPLGRRAAAVPVRLAGGDPAADDPIFVPSRAPTTTRRSTAEHGAPDDYDPDVSRRALHDQRRDNDHALQPYKTLGWTPEMDVSDPDRGGGRAASSSRTRRGRPAGRVRQEPAVRARRGASRPRTRPNPSSHLGNDAPDFVLGDVRRLLRRPADGRGQRQARARRGHACTTRSTAARRSRPTRPSGRAASASAARATSTTTACAARSRAPSPATRSRSGSSPQAASARTRSRTSVQADTGDRCWCCRPRTTPGQQPRPTPARPGPYYLEQYKAALTANDVPTTSTTSTRSGRTAPDPLGVLSHYKAVIWYTGNDLVIREPGQRRRRPARRSSPTTRSSPSATTSTRAASCSTPARTPAFGSSTEFALQPGRPAAVLQGDGHARPDR